MSSARKLAQQARSVFRPALAAATCLAAALVFGLADRAAAGQTEVWVLTAGGVDELAAMTVDEHGEAPSIEGSGRLPLNLEDRPVATYTDLVVWPGGSVLLADGSGSGGVVFDEQGDQTDQLFEPNTLDAPAGLVVSSFTAPDRPTELLMAEQTGEVSVYDTVDEVFTFGWTPTRQGTDPRLSRAVALPDRRAAVAVQWPQLEASTVEIVDLRQTEGHTVVTSEAGADDAPRLERLHPVHNLMADLDGRLLVTSRDRIAIVDEDGTLEWNYDIGQFGQTAGVFEAAFWLESGRIVAATRQPGLWNEPHTNHRLHLLDPDADPPHRASGPPLEGAPLQLDAADEGHGATGTRGHYAGAFGPAAAPPSDLTVTGQPAVDPPEIPLDGVGELSFELTNETDRTIGVRRAEFRAHSAPCGADDLEEAPTTTWWRTDNPDDLTSNDAWSVQGTQLAADDLNVGLWCGRLVVLDTDGVAHRLGPPVDVEILAPDDGPDSPVESDDLTAFDDAGLPSDFRPGDDDAGGCGCRTARSSPDGSMVLLVMAMLMVWVWRRRPGRRERHPHGPPE